MGLILVSPLCKAPSWTEWLCNKVHYFFSLIVCTLSNYTTHLVFTLENMKEITVFIKRVNYLQVMSNLLYICGMCGIVKELLLMRYFSKVCLESILFKNFLICRIDKQLDFYWCGRKFVAVLM